MKRSSRNSLLRSENKVGPYYLLKDYLHKLLIHFLSHQIDWQILPDVREIVGRIHHKRRLLLYARPKAHG
ncbi:hypothetical protein [Escherichia phage AnYang]|uniref:Uncharacterized protein n=1 Tax=Escherichia phage AnYang TaxID=2499909 RepID=A0A410T4L2_9CAUD|nr:hypothetical protein KNU29_gp041 [Escherichia phage AnYang]QAU03576.1 hypothetical protein [Escherichia phage AnYang]